jgi:hypothetical protein
MLLMNTPEKKIRHAPAMASKKPKKKKSNTPEYKRKERNLNTFLTRSMPLLISNLSDDYEMKVITLTIPGEKFKQMASLVNQDMENFITICDIKNKVLDDLEIVTSESVNEHKNMLLCSQITAHTHPNKVREFNPPSSFDIHSSIATFKRCVSNKSNNLILTHLVFTTEGVYTYTISPLLFGMSTKNLDWSYHDSFQFLDWLSGGNPSNKAFINFKTFQNYCKEFYIDVKFFNYNTDVIQLGFKFKISVLSLKTTPTAMLL